MSLGSTIRGALIGILPSRQLRGGIARKYMGICHLAAYNDRACCKTLITLTISRSVAERSTRTHLAKRVELTLRALEKQLDRLPKDQQLITHFHGEYYVLNSEAAAALRKKELMARRLNADIPEWMRTVLPVHGIGA